MSMLRRVGFTDYIRRNIHGPDLRVNGVGVADRGEYMNLQLNDTEYM